MRLGGGAEFSLLVESWDEVAAFVSCEETGCEARMGGIGKVKSLCTIWRLSAWRIVLGKDIYLLQSGNQSCEQAWPLFT